MTTLNKKWEYMGLGDDDHLYDEEGNKRPITTADYVLPFGKYKDMTLEEVSDTSYLLWLQKSNLEKKPIDWYMDRVISMRLKELK